MAPDRYSIGKQRKFRRYYGCGHQMIKRSKWPTVVFPRLPSPANGARDRPVDRKMAGPARSRPDDRPRRAVRPPAARSRLPRRPLDADAQSRPRPAIFRRCDRFGSRSSARSAFSTRSCAAVPVPLPATSRSAARAPPDKKRYRAASRAGARAIDKERTLAEVAFLGLGVMGYPMAGHSKAAAATTSSSTTAPRPRPTGSRSTAAPAADAARGGARPRDGLRLRRQRRRPARGRRSAPTAPSPAWSAARSSSTTPPPPPTSRASWRGGREARPRLRRRAGLRRPGGGRERRADGDVRRRRSDLRHGRAGRSPPTPAPAS